MGRLNVGPASAGADPGPACYDRGGERPTVTDADVVLGRIDPADFAGGSLQLVPELAADSIRGTVGRPLELADPVAALSISEVVDENMANAARVHAVEWGKDVSARTMIAFGGAAPLHAARLAQKLDVDRVIVPTGAGVGSAIGMLRAAVSYEVVRSRYTRLSEFDPRAANALLGEMQAEARAVVLAGAGAGAELEETRHAYMRYVGQGHEIVVPLASRTLADADRETLAAAFDTEYARLFSRTLPDQEREVLSWTLTVTARRDSSITSAMKDGTLASPTAVSVGSPVLQPAGGQGPAAAGRRLFDAIRADYVTAATYRRNDLVPDGAVAGPAVIVEEQTTTVVPDGFQVVVNSLGYLILERRDPLDEGQGLGN